MVSALLPASSFPEEKEEEDEDSYQPVLFMFLMRTLVPRRKGKGSNEEQAGMTG